MFYSKHINILRFFALVSLIAALSACSDSGPVFDPDVPPRNVQVVSGDSNSNDVHNTISWTFDPTATGYVVYVSDTPGVDDSSAQVVPSAAGPYYVKHSGLDVDSGIEVVAGMPLYYRVQAVSGSQVSVLSMEVTGTPEESTTQHNLNDVAWDGDDTLVAVGDSATLITSGSALTDGWSLPADLGALDESLSAVTWNSDNGQFLVVGAGLTVLTSNNGSTWEFQDLSGLTLSTGNATDLEDVAWVVDRYLVVGKNSVILSSEDGIDWNVKNDAGAADNITLQGVASNGDGSVTIAVGTNGTLLISEDKGENWAAWTVSENNNLNDVTWDGNQFIVVGSDDTAYISADGANWEEFHPKGSNVNLVGVTHWDSSLPPDPFPAIVGSAGTLYVYPDAASKISVETATNEELSANTWVDDGLNPAYLVIVGHDGFVLTGQIQ